MSYGTEAVPMDEEDEKEQKVYITLSLAKYPFLKNKKVGQSGEANFKGEIERSESKEEDAVHHTIAFHDIGNASSGGRV